MIFRILYILSITITMILALLPENSVHINLTITLASKNLVNISWIISFCIFLLWLSEHYSVKNRKNTGYLYIFLLLLLSLYLPTSFTVIYSGNLNNIIIPILTMCTTVMAASIIIFINKIEKRTVRNSIV